MKKKEKRRKKSEERRRNHSLRETTKGDNHAWNRRVGNRGSWESGDGHDIREQGRGEKKNTTIVAEYGGWNSPSASGEECLLSDGGFSGAFPASEDLSPIRPFRRNRATRAAQLTTQGEEEERRITLELQLCIPEHPTVQIQLLLVGKKEKHITTGMGEKERENSDPRASDRGRKDSRSRPCND